MSNTFGTLFRFTTFGESHGAGIGVVVDGCPAGIALDLEAMRTDVERRRPGKSRITTQRRETDDFQVLSGLFEGHTTGTPLTFWVPNTDTRSKDYDEYASAFRPSHADYTYHVKYNGHRDWRGGGRSSARETVARVIAGAVAKQVLARELNLTFTTWVQEIGGTGLPTDWRPAQPLSHPTPATEATQCPDPEMAETLFALVDEVRKAGDSVGGVVCCEIAGLPAGIGEPIYDKLSALLGAAMLGINAVKGFEIGSGFDGARMRGSEHNDLWETTDDRQQKTEKQPGNSQRQATSEQPGGETTDDRKQKTDEQPEGARLKAQVNPKLLTPDSSLQTSDFGLPTPDSSLQTPDFRLLTPDSPLQTPDFGLLTPDSPLQTPHSPLQTLTNHSGGIQGGISNGMPVFFRVAFKPTATLMRDVPAVDVDGNPVILPGKGRHDPCVVPRAVPIVEAMAAAVLADLWLQFKARR